MKLLMNGQPVDARRVEVVNSDERSSTYLLKNGATVRVRHVLIGVYALAGQRDGLGRPQYHVESHLIAVVDEEEVVTDEAPRG